MTEPAKILAFAGSARKASWNKQLVALAADGARAAGAEVTLIDLADFPMPLYDGDLEADAGLPENAVKLRALFGAHDGLLIASPEYNSSISPLLKNVIDWVSRPTAEDGQLKYLAGKTAALLATSPGGLGGLRGLAHLRQILSSINVLVAPQQLAVASAGSAFSDDGNLTDAGQLEAVRNIGASLARLTAALN